MRWGVNISLLVAAGAMLGLMEGIVSLDSLLAYTGDPEFYVAPSDLWVEVYLIVLNAAMICAAACNGAGFFRQRRGAPTSWILHLSNAIFLVLYLPGLVFLLATIYAGVMPEGAPLAHLAALMSFVPIAAITGVYVALLRRRRVVVI